MGPRLVWSEPLDQTRPDHSDHCLGHLLGTGISRFTRGRKFLDAEFFDIYKQLLPIQSHLFPKTRGITIANLLNTGEDETG
jgi:hypothetical protein